MFRQRDNSEDGSTIESLLTVPFKKARVNGYYGMTGANEQHNKLLKVYRQNGQLHMILSPEGLKESLEKAFTTIGGESLAVDAVIVYWQDDGWADSYPDKDEWAFHPIVMWSQQDEKILSEIKEQYLSGRKLVFIIENANGWQPYIELAQKSGGEYFTVAVTTNFGIRPYRPEYSLFYLAEQIKNFRKKIWFKGYDPDFADPRNHDSGLVFGDVTDKGMYIKEGLFINPKETLLVVNRESYKKKEVLAYVTKLKNNGCGVNFSDKFKWLGSFEDLKVILDHSLIKNYTNVIVFNGTDMTPSTSAWGNSSPDCLKYLPGEQKALDAITTDYFSEGRRFIFVATGDGGGPAARAPYLELAKNTDGAFLTFEKRWEPRKGQIVPMRQYLMYDAYFRDYYYPQYIPDWE